MNTLRLYELARMGTLGEMGRCLELKNQYKNDPKQIDYYDRKYAEVKKEFDYLTDVVIALTNLDNKQKWKN